MRSYFGKAYFEEKRDTLAETEFEQAKRLDPEDPTPWFYDAIEKQTTNRPVAALHSLEHAIANNDNRAVYRSKLLLDQDLAARSAALGRIYSDLGFEQRALSAAFNEFNPLFLRDGPSLQTSGVVGDNDTYGEEVVHSGVWKNVSYSLGQLHYETQGFRPNDDVTEDLYTAFVQARRWKKTCIGPMFIGPRMIASP